MRRLSMVALIIVVTSLSNACVATRKFTRNEVKTSADTLNGRIDKTNGEVGELKDGVARVDGRVTAVDGKVTAVDGKVSDLDTRTTQRFDGVRNEVRTVDQKAANAQSSADKVATNVSTLDEKFQNRNQYSVAGEKAVLFRFDSAKLDAKYQADLEELASMLQRNPDALIVLEGRTDSKGDSDYNVKLGERRVEAVKRFLAVDKGVPVYRMHEISFGSAKPLAENNSREGREKNRTVVLTILVPKASGASSAAKTPNQ
jgi:outer membrane protein OmpA-like peptidoglycan-associated protein